MVELMLALRGTGGERVLVLPPVDGPCWTSDCLAISREWVAFKEEPRRASWNVVPYAAVSSVRPFDASGIVYIRPDGSGVVIGATVLASLEACTVLADGLSANPAVAPDAAKLLQPCLEAARARRESSLARLHAVNRSGATHTFRFHRGKWVTLGVFLVAFGAVSLALGMGNLISPAAFQGGLGGTLLLIGGGLGFAWLGIRSFRVGVQVRDRKLIIHNELRGRVVDAGDIRAITLEPKAVSQVATHWIAQVELTEGRSLWIDDFDCGPAKRPPDPEMAAAVEKVRVLLGIGADEIPMPQSHQPTSIAGDAVGEPFPGLDSRDIQDAATAAAGTASPPPGGAHPMAAASHAGSGHLPSGGDRWLPPARRRQ